MSYEKPLEGYKPSRVPVPIPDIIKEIQKQREAGKDDDDIRKDMLETKMWFEWLVNSAFMQLAKSE